MHYQIRKKKLQGKKKHETGQEGPKRVKEKNGHAVRAGSRAYAGQLFKSSLLFKAYDFSNQKISRLADMGRIDIHFWANEYYFWVYMDYVKL